MPKAVKSEKKKRKVQAHAPLLKDLQPAKTYKEKKIRIGGADRKEWAEEETNDEMVSDKFLTLGNKMLRNDEGTFVSPHVQDKGEEDSVSVDEDQGFEYEEDISDTDDLIEVQGNYVAGGSGLTDAEEAIVSQFLKSDGTQMKTLADIIIEKIREKGVTPSSSSVVKSIATEAPIPPKVIEVFSAVGKMLQHYKSGKLPKALKMLPHLKNWEVQSDV